MKKYQRSLNGTNPTRKAYKIKASYKINPKLFHFKKYFFFPNPTGNIVIMQTGKKHYN